MNIARKPPYPSVTLTGIRILFTRIDKVVLMKESTQTKMAESITLKCPFLKQYYNSIYSRHLYVLIYISVPVDLQHSM